MSIFDSLQLAKDVGGKWMGDVCPKTVERFSFDTRTMNRGDLFLALRGENRDGHDYLDLALKSGASGAIVERFHPECVLPQLKVEDTLKAFQQIARLHRENFDGVIFGITGSCGKTSTKDLLTQLLGPDCTHSTFVNNNNLLGVPSTLVQLDLESHMYAVIEAGTNRVGEMECLASMIQPDVSIVTNIYPVHLDGLGTLANIAYEKSFLCRATKAGGYVIFPSACFQFELFRSFGDKARVLVYEGDAVEVPEDQVIFYRVEEKEDGTILLTVRLPDSGLGEEYALPILSEGMLSNVALAVSACLLVGIERRQIEEGVRRWVPSEYRGEIYKNGKQVYYVDCYNANPAAMRDALNIFQKHFDSSYRRLYILGCMGELGTLAAQSHYDIGVSLKLGKGDRVLLLGCNAEDYERGLKAAGNEACQIVCLQNKESAFEYLECFEGAVFLKGSKPYALWELLPVAC